MDVKQSSLESLEFSMPITCTCKQAYLWVTCVSSKAAKKSGKGMINKCRSHEKVTKVVKIFLARLDFPLPPLTAPSPENDIYILLT